MGSWGAAAARVGTACLVLALVSGCSGSGPHDPRPTGSAAPDSSSGSSLAHRAVHSMTALADGSLLVAGGCVEDGCSVATDSVVVLSTSGEREVGAMSGPRDGHTATLLDDGRVLVTGGYSGEGEPPLASAEVFDPGTGDWSRLGEMAGGRGGHVAAVLGDGRVLVAGGWVSMGTPTASTDVFDPASDRFVPGPDLPVAVDGLAATSLADGRVLVTGGQRSKGVASGMAVLVSPDGSMERVDGLAQPRFKHALVTLPSGEALVLGGTPDDRLLLSDTELFDPATGRFRAGPDLAAGRYKLTGSAVVLPDGRVAVAGGGPGLEVLDVTRGVSETVPAVPAQRASFSTVGVLGDELVLLGGYDQQIQLTDTDERIALADLT